MLMVVGIVGFVLTLMLWRSWCAPGTGATPSTSKALPPAGGTAANGDAA